MYLLLAGADDVVATDVGAVLRGRDPGTDVVRVSPRELFARATWTHRLGAGRPSTTIELHDGRQIVSSRISGVLNRIRYIEGPPFTSRRDADYAQLEVFALTLSWLRSLTCPLVNPPGPRGLSGPELTDVMWLAHASACGLPTTRRRLTTRRAEQGDEALRVVGDVFVAGDEVVGPPTVRDGALRLASRVGCRLLRLGFVETRGGRVVVSDVTPHPERISLAAAQLVADYVAPRTSGRR